MKSGEARLGEAVAALTTVLEREGVEDARRKAHDFFHEHLLAEGWRASGPAAYRPKPGGEKHAHPDTAKREATVAREQIAEARAKFAASQILPPPEEQRTDYGGDPLRPEEIA